MGSATASLWSPIFSGAINDDTFSKGPDELPDFLSNILHESGKLTRLEERLSYSAGRIREIGAGAREGTRWFRAAQQADALAHDPRAFAEFMYGGRYGNTEPGMGYLYRGRSPIQLTFFDNYARVGDLMGQDLIGVPDLATQPHFALEVAIAWWEDKVPDAYVGNSALVRRVVNGGSIGLQETRELARIVQTSIREYVA